jgi:hypothetical protein
MLLLPRRREVHDTDTLDNAACTIAASPKGTVPDWRPPASPNESPSGARFIGMISVLDIAASGARDRALRAVVSEVVQPNPGLLKEIHPGTR